MKVIRSLCLFVVLSSCFLIYSSDDPIVRLFDGTTPEKFELVIQSLRQRLSSIQLEDVSVREDGLFAMRATSISINPQEESTIDVIVNIVRSSCQEDLLFTYRDTTFHRYSKGFPSQKPYVVIAEGSDIHIAEAFERDL